MQSLQDLLKTSGLDVTTNKKLRSTESSRKEEDGVDYWTYYFTPGNSIRKWDEEHGVHLTRNPMNGMPVFDIDRDMLKDDNVHVIFPAYFQGRTLDRFSTRVYSYGNQPIAKKALDAVTKYVRNVNKILEEYHGPGLYFYSKTKGSGKTFLSTILGNELTQLGFRVRWYSMVNLIQEMKAGFDKESGTSFSSVLNAAKQCEMLILDDIGVEKQSAWLNETLFSILDYRLTTCLPTFYTSNLKPEELSYDERIIDRITRMTELIPLPEENVRKRLNSQSQFGAFLEG